MQDFIHHHQDKIIGVLRGFDRMRFRGTLRLLSSAAGLESYMKYCGVLIKNFKNWSMSLSQIISSSSEQSEKFSGRPNIYLNNPGINKEKLAREIAERDGIKEGPICILRAVEPCWSFNFHTDKVAKKIKIVSEFRKCTHIYQYQMHPNFGLMHARLQTWLPFNVFICMNGREWLSRQLDTAGIGYCKKANCFTEIENLRKAQNLLDKQLETNWTKELNKIVQELNPGHSQLFKNYPLEHYWSLNESEWATDLMFKSEAILTGLYEQLLRYGITTLGSCDVLRFLGQKTPAQGGVHGNFKGEVTSDLKQRPEGIRIKHRVNKNSVKMYNKQGSVLRIETTMNHTRDFKVLRRPERTPRTTKPSWQKLRKGVADIKRRAAISDACNQRYLASLSTLSNTSSLGDITCSVSKPVSWKKNKVRALNTFQKDDAALLRAVSKGQFALLGFRNKDLRPLLFTSTKNPDLIKAQRGKVTRRLRLLRAHGLIAKVPHAHRYLLTDKGRTLCAALDAAAQANTQQLLKIAA